MISKTAFISFNYGAGVGGHYFSMAETARSDIFHEPEIIDMGFNESLVLNGVRTCFIRHSWLGNGKARWTLRSLLVERGIKFVLCYDIAAYNITRRALKGVPLRIIYIKCGGPVLTHYYPISDNIIVFSDEDVAFFRHKCPGAHLAHIPNRISEANLTIKQVRLAQKDQEINAVQGAAQGEVEQIVCVARIGASYERKILCAINYLKTRLAAGRPARLTVIGAIQQDEVYKRLVALCPVEVKMLTDSYHIQDASKFLSNFDTAVTTGRGTFEAVLLGLNCLVPYDDAESLAPLTVANYPGLKRSNFSGRARRDEIPEKEITVEAEVKGDVDVLRKMVRTEFAIEAAELKFRTFFDKARINMPLSVTDELAGKYYYFYEALRERVGVVRVLLRAFRTIPSLRLRQCRSRST